jgi:hypothetical protein
MIVHTKLMLLYACIRIHASITMCIHYAYVLQLIEQFVDVFKSKTTTMCYVLCSIAYSHIWNNTDKSTAVKVAVLHMHAAVNLHNNVVHCNHKNNTTCLGT